MQGGDTQALALAADASEAAQVDGALVSAARERVSMLEDMERKRAEELRARTDEQIRKAEIALADAMSNEDNRALLAAIENAEAAGANPQLLSIAKDAQRRLQERKRQRATEAEAALRVAAVGDSVQALMAALTEGEAAGVSSACLEDAHQRLRELAMGVDNKAEAVASLTAALDGANVQEILEAIANAEAAGVEHWILQSAHARLRLQREKTDAVQALAEAAAGVDAGTLAAAITNGEALGVDAGHLCRAKETLQEMERRKTVSDAALRTAAAGHDPMALSAAIAGAEAAGGDDLLLSEARSKLVELREVTRRRTEAATRLTGALSSEDMQGLAATISNAEDVGVDRSLILDGQRRLQELTDKMQRRRNAEAALAHAMARNELPALAESVGAAEAAGVHNELIGSARHKLQELMQQVQRRTSAEVVLAEAVAADDTQALSAAIIKAEAVGVHSSFVTNAQRRLQELTDLPYRKMSAEEELERAAREGDATVLAAAIVNAETAGVASNLISNARQRLTEMRETAQHRRSAEAALAEAADKRDIPGLIKAIKAAEACGANDVLVSYFQRRLEDMAGEESRRRNAQAALVAAENSCHNIKELANSISAAAPAGDEATCQRLKLEPPGDGHESTTCADDSNDGRSLPTTDSAKSSPQLPTGAGALFDQLDTNGDGFIDRAEFNAGCMPGLAPSDTEVALRNRRENCPGAPLPRQRGMSNLTPTPRTLSAGSHRPERVQRRRPVKPWIPTSNRPQAATPTGGRRCSSVPELASARGQNASVHPPALRSLAACPPPARRDPIRTGLPPRSFATPQRAAQRQPRPPPASSAGAALHGLPRRGGGNASPNAYGVLHHAASDSRMRRGLGGNSGGSGMGSLRNAGASLITQRAHSVFVL